MRASSVLRATALCALTPLVQSCLLGTDPPTVNLPWDVDGRYEGEATGTLNGQPYTGTVSMLLLRAGVQVSETGPTIVSIFGSWSWGSEEGEVIGYWVVGKDLDASASGACPEFADACSLIMRIYPENDYCTDAPLGQVNPIDFLGWWEGPDLFVGAGVDGTFWDFQSEPAPCTGEVVVDFGDAGFQLSRVTS